MCGEDAIAFENGTQPVRLNRTHLAASPRSRDESCDGGKGEWVGSGAVRICCHHGVAWCRAAAKEATMGRRVAEQRADGLEVEARRAGHEADAASSRYRVTAWDPRQKVWQVRRRPAAVELIADLI